MAKLPTGIRARHARTCPTAADKAATCRCTPYYEASVYSARDGRKIRRCFPTLSEARAFRHDAASAVRKGTMRAPTATTLRETAEAWLEGAEAGEITNRSGDPYKLSVLRGYRAALEKRVLPELGAAKLSAISRRDVQDFADGLRAEGLDASTIRNTLMPLRAIFRRALARGEVAVNPTSGLELPAVRGRRDRIASPAEAAKLIGALPDADRALWASAFYAGLRRGELMALRVEDIDLDAGVIRVARSWDVREGAIEPKSRAGRRTVPIPAVLREHLMEHLMLHLGRSHGLVFGRTATVPFEPVSLAARAEKAWKAANARAKKDGRDEKLEPITLHEARHTYASLMIAAGVNAKALSTYMGHSSVTITYDRYGHLMPGNEDEAAALLDTYLKRADTKARLAQVAAPICRAGQEE